MPTLISKGSFRGQRQYSLNELVKLAVIHELLNSRYLPSEIPQEIDTIWYALQAMHDEPVELPSADAKDDDAVHGLS